MIFEHPKLKGIRVKKARVVRFTLVDDTPTETNPQVTIGDVIEQISTETAKHIATRNDNKIVDVQSFPSTGQWDNNDNQTEIQD